MRAAVRQSPWLAVHARERAERLRQQARVDARVAADTLYWAEWHEALEAAEEAGDEEEAERLRTGCEVPTTHMPPATEAELEAEAAAVDAASEALEERRLERAARHVLFDDLQREWSDATFLAERDRLERQDEEDEVAVGARRAGGRRGRGPLGGLRLSTGRARQVGLRLPRPGPGRVPTCLRPEKR